MEKILNIPILEKSVLKKVKAGVSRACCTPKNGMVTCCIPSKTQNEHGAACCAQPEDGSACCNK